MALNGKLEAVKKYAGVFKMPDGRLVVQVAIKIAGVQRKARKVLAKGTTPAQAVQVGEELKAQLRAPQTPTIPTPLPPATSQTVEEYARQWLVRRAPKLKPSALASHENALINFILPRLGHLPCSALRGEAIESWVNWALAQRRKDNGERYREATMRTWWRTLVTMSGDLAAHYERADPTRRVEPPVRPDLEPAREQRVLKGDQVRLLVDHAKQHCKERHCEIVILAFTGMRSGELFALKWEVVNFAASQIFVRRSVSKTVLTETTKTKSNRMVPLTAELCALLLEHRDYQRENASPAQLASGLIFPSDRGTPRTANSLDKPFDLLRVVMKTDIRIGAHVLRRSLNTNLGFAGVDSITRWSIMGHSSEKMTKLYTHISVSDKAAALSKLWGNAATTAGDAASGTGAADYSALN